MTRKEEEEEEAMRGTLTWTDKVPERDDARNVPQLVRMNPLIVVYHIERCVKISHA